MEETKDNGLHQEFTLARRPTFLKIKLDAILNNLQILKGHLATHTEVIAVVKANGYGHGSVAVSQFLEKNGYRHFAVATALEGEELRQGGIHGNTHVLGNASVEEIQTYYRNRLIPTTGDVQFLASWLRYCQQCENNGDGGQTGTGVVGQIVIKVDSGMSRNGCQPEDLSSIMQFCENNAIPVHSLMTHFSQSWDDPTFTQKQYDLFMKTAQPYRLKGMKLHVANSGAIVNKIGVDLDYVRPGISMYGQPPDTSEYGVSTTRDLGLRPAISWLAKANLVKKLSSGRVVGYDRTYRCEHNETLATIPVGYADGYLRNMFSHGVLTTRTGMQCPVVGRVSMDAITITLPDGAKDCREFHVITDDFNEVNSVMSISKKADTIPYEVCTNLDRRIPRIYETGGVSAISVSQ